MSEAVDRREMIALFRKELELCRVGPDETVAVLSEGLLMRDYAEAFVVAAQELGATAIDLNLPTKKETSKVDRLENFGKNQLSSNPEWLETLTQSDLVIDLLVASFSPEQTQILQSGARMLLVAEEFETLARLLPTERMKDATRASEQLLLDATRFRFTNQAGTDVSYRLGKFKPIVEYGFADVPGHWDHWPAGFVATLADKRGVEGFVVMDRGDILFPHGKHLKQPVTFEIEDGFITDVRGGEEASELKSFMENYDDPQAFEVSHIGWGLHPGAEWTTGGIGMDGRSYYGNVLFSTGPNLEFGGDNNSSCHLDLPMRNCTAYVDDEMIIRDGDIIADNLKAI